MDKKAENTKEKGKYRPVVIVSMCLGVIAIGISVGLMRIANFGTDPFSCMNLGISSHLPVSYGTCQLLVNLVLFIVMVLALRKAIGLGTLVNMAGCGYTADFLLWILGHFNISTESMDEHLVIRVVLMLAAVVLLGFGAGLYMQCDIGIAPYDALGQVIEQAVHGKLQYKWTRIGTDLICVTVGFLLGSVVGVATVITAFFTGPLVTFFRNWLAKTKLLN
ncbi:MAG: hypothetical protein K2K96_07350 [Lachnospiraceae bacterium]|nr:hypothetical protein [Lachnospiraceae bacterium]